ncbi:hypothetical protein [Streptomyces sp. WAC06614]|uniref:HAAS signaling domain-containing protein n=1 Tax=Streptomyces sp. WAC06614 TaxID=2487416 RepID=UPI000F7AAE7B|nr:hypothetical protein [Streptomyces sp. WAC06614]RSS81858.1 hypothetical protein EF918_09005 [Streptomyces sp. WAC06614]
MHNIEHPLVTAYLKAVESEASALDPKHRGELLADLAEHIEVAFAERPAHTEAEVRAILHHLGDPAAIVAMARDIGSSVPPVKKRHRLAPLILLPVAGPLGVLHPVLGGLVMIVGLALLRAAPHWSRRDKIIGAAAAVLTPMGAALVALTSPGQLTPLLLLTLLAAVTLLPAAASLYLFRAGRHTGP